MNTPPIESGKPTYNIPSSELCYKMLTALVNDNEHIEKHPIYLYPESQKTAVIIDPRYDNLMKAVIHNFMFFMNPLGWNLCIVSFSGYEDIIKRDFPNCQFEPLDDRTIHMDENGIPNLSINQYNRLLKSEFLWQNKTEHIAIFQKDCIMFHMFPVYFDAYDFAGANFGKWNYDSSPYGGINGGFSLRKRSAMLECIQRFSTSIPLYHNEDYFFTLGCERLNRPVPPVSLRPILAIELEENHPDTSIFHGWNKYAKPTDFILGLLAKSPLFCRYM